jgi:hypothetical protein
MVGPVAEMGNEEGVLVADMDLGLLEIAEENYKVRMDLGREGWYYSYRHGDGRSKGIGEREERHEHAGGGGSGGGR